MTDVQKAFLVGNNRREGIKHIHAHTHKTPKYVHFITKFEQQPLFQRGWQAALLGIKSLHRWSSPLNNAHKKGSVPSAMTPSACGCLFSLSLKCCLTAPIYDNRPLIAERNNCTITRRAESRSLLQSSASFSQDTFFSSLTLYQE